jgi:hypothetical protein
MAQERKGTIAQEKAWAEYLAAQLTPEERAAARAETEHAGEEPGDTYALLLDLVGKVDLDYYDLDELREDRDIDMENAVMSQPKIEDTSESARLWEAYQALQLTPEQKAALREKVEKKVDRAAREGVYERVIEIAGTIKWNTSWQSLRLDEW